MRNPAKLGLLALTACLLTLVLLGAAVAQAATLTVTWDPNSEEDLAGYRVYYGTASRLYGTPVTAGKSATSCQLTGLQSGTLHYIALTAFDQSGNESDFSREVSALTASAATYTLATSISPSGSGSVTRSPNATSYASGTQVTLTATPASGYRFDHWGGSATGTANPVTVTMDANKSVTAYFVPITYTLTVSVSGRGTVTRSPNATSYASGTKVTLTARPAYGYRFSRWSGAVSGTTNPVTITMNGNKSVTAYFVRR